MTEQVNKEMEKSVDGLIGSLQDAFVAPSDPPPVVEPVVVAPPVVEPPVVPPVVVPPIVEPPVVPSVVEPPVVTPSVEPSVPLPIVPPAAPVVPASPKDPRDTEMEQMRGTIAELRKLIETTASVAATPQPIVAPPVAPTPVKFLEKEEDLNKILDNVENFNAFMNTVISKANEQVPKATFDMDTIDKIVTQKLAVNEFYAANKDLTSNKAYVGLVANELSAKNPTWTLEDVIKNLATEVRTRLGMSVTPPVGSAPVVAPVETPAFVPGGGTRPGAGGTPLTRVEAGIADLLEGVQV
uniref:Uncharacterized protein n=1 Tax=viral metagenome TaxID=1070528 RepID=A0A6M3KSM6_9ZZZZ